MSGCMFEKSNFVVFDSPHDSVTATTQTTKEKTTASVAPQEIALTQNSPENDISLTPTRSQPMIIERARVDRYLATITMTKK